MHLNGACYYIEKQLLGFSEARDNCQIGFGNGKLFEPKDKDTHDYVVAAAQGILSQGYWLGIGDTMTDGQFQYLSGGNLTFSNWNTGIHNISNYRII